ncbi:MULTISPECIES: PAS domain S-box protein [Aerosakkonema]|uniref:PAS domain S-box protein n=1 Tax=Aerosakkonema TaxID=1246629 RepID=UPI0035B98EB7
MNLRNQKLQQNEVMLQWLNDQADQGIFTTDAKLKILSWNHWLEIHSGTSAQEIIGRNLLEVYPELTQRRLDRFYDRALDGQVVLLSQRLHGYLLPISPRIDNSILTHMLQSARIAPLIEQGRAIGTITVIEDVTERVAYEAELQHQIEALKQTELALLSTYARLQHLLSSNPAVIYTRKFSQAQTITFVSNNVSTKLGYKPQDFTENNNFWIDCIHPQDVSRVLPLAPEMFEDKYCVLEYRFLHKNGTYRWLRDEMKLVLNLEGNVQEIVGAWYDITEDKQVQEKLREQAALIDITTDAILVRDLNAKILFWNKSAEKLYGWTAAEAIGKNANQLLFEIASPQLEEALSTIIEKGEWHGELHQITKYGNEVTVESRWTLVQDERQNLQSILVVNTDITEKKQLETQFLRIQRIESIGNLAAGIAHDMNNILTPILAAAQLLLKMEVPLEKRQHLLNIVEASAKRGANLVKQLLSFARGMEGKRTILNIGHPIAELKHILKQIFPKTIKLQLDIPQNLWTVCGDPTQLDQVLMNLCLNARDAMPDGGELNISAENVFIDEKFARMNIDAKVGPYILLSVLDTGTGIEPRIIDRIFEPFFTTKEIGKGTGFGLSTVLGIVKSHGGFIKVNSQVGKGTEFKVYLPAIKESEIQEAEQVDFPRGQGEMILSVDDEVDIQVINKTILEKYGYRVLNAGNGVEAIKLYKKHKHKISVVLLDMMMPSMDGLSTIRQLQKINPSVKIIACSGLASSTMVESVEKLGVKTFLAKPYTTQEWLKTISRVLA